MRMAFRPIGRTVNAITTGLKGYFSSVNPNEKFENVQNTISARDAMTFGIFNAPEPSFLHIDYFKAFIVIFTRRKT